MSLRSSSPCIIWIQSNAVFLNGFIFTIWTFVDSWRGVWAASSTKNPGGKSGRWSRPAVGVTSGQDWLACWVSEMESTPAYSKHCSLTAGIHVNIRGVVCSRFARGEYANDQPFAWSIIFIQSVSVKCDWRDHSVLFALTQHYINCMVHVLRWKFLNYT